MEPMNLGSPSGSPATNPNYLPSFLLGDMQAMTPRSNTLSPNKASGGRNLSFANTPTSPQDFSRSAAGQRTLFGSSGVGYPQTPTGGMGNYTGAQMQAHNASSTGPPTQGLFDSLRQEQNQLQTPNSCFAPTPQSQACTPMPAHNMSAFGMNQSYQQQTAPPSNQYNDSYLSNASFNASRALASPLGPGLGAANNNIPYGYNSSLMLQCPPTPRYTDFWVTVYGFPPSATSTILQHFAQCGTIVDKVFPPQNGNWVHLKYSSRLECDKALNYNEKILGNNVMIGVTQCKDKSIVDKENLCENASQTPRVRPLAQTAYRSAQSDSAVVASPNAPQKSSGLMNKAMDLFFGW